MKYLSKHRKAFILPEIIISLTLLVIVSMPILNFLFTHNSLHILKREQRLPFTKISYGEEYDVDQSIGMSNLAHLWSISDLQEYDTGSGCDVFFGKIFDRVLSGSILKSKKGNLAWHANEQQDFLQIEYPNVFKNILASTTNIAAALSLMKDRNHAYLLIGTNSASTTDPDMYVYRKEIGANVLGNNFAPLGYIRFGPGIIKLSANSNHILGIERSATTPLRYAHRNSLLNSLAQFEASDTYALRELPSGHFKTIASSSINNTYPMQVYVNGDTGIIGSEKNLDKELYLIDLKEGSGSGVQVGGAEIGAGVNGIDMKKGKIYVATPKNPELQIFEIENGATTGLKEIFSYDAQGSSGNGKSISVIDGKAFLGRTVGNDEFYTLWQKTRSLISDTFPGFLTEFSDIDESVQSLIPIQNGRVMVLRTNRADKALIFLVDTNLRPKPAFGSYLNQASAGSTPSKSQYQTWFTVSLPAIPNDIACDSDHAYIAMQSAVQPVAVISIH